MTYTFATASLTASSTYAVLPTKAQHLPMPGGGLGVYFNEECWWLDWFNSWERLRYTVEREIRHALNSMTHAMSYHSQETQ